MTDSVGHIQDQNEVILLVKNQSSLGSFTKLYFIEVKVVQVVEIKQLERIVICSFFYVYRLTDFSDTRKPDLLGVTEKSFVVKLGEIQDLHCYA